ncbi:MAG: 50S ribosomal protein L10, partial [Actinobacteria bacterium]|nr:50S ribosomal protein L10 [Actinomycetota bacterium]
MANKEATIAEISEAIRTSSGVLLTEYRGLTVAQLKELRGNIRANASYAVVKNTLAKRAFNAEGISSFDAEL